MEEHEIVDAVASITLILGRTTFQSTLDLRLFCWDVTERGLVEVHLDTRKGQLQYHIPDEWVGLDHPTDVQRMALDGVAYKYQLTRVEYVKEKAS